jgi:hypothetical protein
MQWHGAVEPSPVSGLSGGHAALRRQARQQQLRHSCRLLFSRSRKV